MRKRGMRVSMTLTTVLLAAACVLSVPAGALAAKGGNGGGGGGGGKPGGGGGDPPAGNPEVVYVQQGLAGKGYVMDIDGANKLAPWTDDVRGPSWSADGTEIVFYSYGSPSGFHRSAPDGSGMTFITDVIVAAGNNPEWSPVPTVDGEHALVYMDDVMPGDTSNGIWIVNLDGTSKQLLTPDAGVEYVYNDPCWSHDATEIAASRVHISGTYALVLFTLGMVNGDVAITSEDVLDFSGTPLADATLRHPSLSRTGNGLVAFTASTAHGPGSPPTDIYVADLINPAAYLVNLTDTPDQDERAPSWCGGDGDVVFLGEGSRSYSVFLIPSTGGAPTDIGDAPKRKSQNNPACKF